MAVDSYTFGSYLKAARKKNKISLKEVSGELKLPIKILLHIETENLNKLPPEVFTKGFIRAYAKIVGADENKAIKDYISSINSCDKIKKIKSNLDKYKISFKRRLFFLFIVLLSIISLSVFLFSFFQEKQIESENINNTVTNEKQQSVIHKAAPANLSEPDLRRAGETLLLKITAVNKIWVKVIIDTQNAKKYTFAPGDQMEFEAVSSFNLLISDAQGAKLLLNNTPMNIPGKKESVVCIQIP